MINNDDIKRIKSLHASKFRQKYNNFIVEGHKSCLDFIRSGRYRISHLYYTSKAATELLNISDSIPTTEIDQKIMKKISALKTPTPILMEVEFCQDNKTEISSLNGFGIYMDSIQDPGNVGTILRIADWFGMNYVIRNATCADFYNPKVVQASMGSLSKVPVYTMEDASLVNYKHAIFGTYMDGKNINSISWPINGMIILGNEGRGISEKLSQRITTPIHIPGSPARSAESLNVAISAGIVCQSIFSFNGIRT